MIEVDLARDVVPNDSFTERSLMELEAAYKLLDESCYDHMTNHNKLKIVNAFDCCYEVVLKVLKKELVTSGVHVYSQVDIFKEASINKIIINLGRWFLYMEKRDLINCSYNSRVVDEIVKVIPMFKYDVSELIAFLKTKK